jgi:hypothetical protein
MSSARPHCWCLAFCVFAALVPTVALAQTQPTEPQPTEAQLTEARTHFDRGVILFDGGDNDGALVEFRRAYELSRRPTVLFNIAATCQALRRYGDAIEALRRFLAESTEDQRRQRRDAERTLHDLEQLIAHVVVLVDPADATLQIDGRVQSPGVSLILGPGTHRIQVSRDGRRTHLEELTITSGETRELRVSLPPMEGAGGDPIPVGGGRASLNVVGAPAGATLTVDGHPSPTTAPLTLPSGPHRVDVLARAHRPWSGTVVLRAGVAHRLQVALAPDQGRLSPTPFWVTTAGAGAFLLGTIITGAVAIDANAQYRALPGNDPRLADLESRGRGFGLAADILGVATIGLGAAAIYLFLKTDFRTSTAQFVAAPSSLGAVWSF